MSIKIIEANVEKDIDLFVSLLNHNRTRTAGRDRFEWLYLQNPFGRAKAWLAKDEKDGSVVGFTAVFPRAIRVMGEDTICWNCGDFSIDKKYRSLGVALKLRKAAKECVDKNEVSFLYAHPNDKMKIIHMKAGHHKLGEMVRYTKLLKTDRKVQEVVSNRILLGILITVGNVAMRWADKKHKIASNHEFVIYKKNAGFRFDEQFDRLFKDNADNQLICGIRNSEYLNWRYIDNPLYSTEVAVIVIGNKLAGYIVYFIENSVAVFKDIFCINDETIKKDIVSCWIQSMRERDVHSISVIFLDTNRWIKVFQDFGFVKREGTSSVFIYPNSQYKFANYITNAENWYMTVGDRDV